MIDQLKKVKALNLEMAVGPRKKVQDFDPESLDAGVEHSQKVKEPPASRGSGSKDCAFLSAPTVVSRLNHKRNTSIMFLL